MQTQATTVQEYLDQLPDDRRAALTRLRQTILDNLPEGFAETMGPTGPGYCVPHSLYPAGYPADPRRPMPFITIASQKNYIALYHMGIYANPKLLQWFVGEYPKYSTTRLDMGKGCIRFKKIDQIPYELIGELVKKINPRDFLNILEKIIKKTK